MGFNRNGVIKKTGFTIHVLLLIVIVSCGKSNDFISLETIGTATSSEEISSEDVLSEKTPSETEYYEIKLERKNGLEDSRIIEYFKTNFIIEVDIPSETNLLIDCYDFDLNSDGYNDKIILVEGSSFGGTAGNPIYILINDHDDNYVNHGNTLLMISAYSPSNALNNEFKYNDNEFYVSNEKTNGFYNIIIRNGEDLAELRYSDGRYEIYNYSGEILRDW